jgi:uncharacterized protein
MLAGGMLGAIGGSLCSSLLPERYYNKITGIIMLLLSAQMLYSYVKKRKSGAKTDETQESGVSASSVSLAIIYGLFGGAMSGLVGLSGGGPIIVGLSVLGCGALETVGTSMLVLLGISVTGFAMHLGLGSIDWRLVALLTLGTVAGAIVAPLALKRIDKRRLESYMQPLLLLFVIGMGVALVAK